MEKNTLLIATNNSGQVDYNKGVLDTDDVKSRALHGMEIPYRNGNGMEMGWKWEKLWGIHGNGMDLDWNETDHIIF